MSAYAHKKYILAQFLLIVHRSAKYAPENVPEGPVYLKILFKFISPMLNLLIIIYDLPSMPIYAIYKYDTYLSLTQTAIRHTVVNLELSGVHWL
jgi:hypothetical protein